MTKPDSVPNLNNGDSTAMSEALRKAGITPKTRRGQGDGPTGKIWQYLDSNTDKIRSGLLTRADVGRVLRGQGINANSVSPQINRWRKERQVDFIDSKDRMTKPKTRRSAAVSIEPARAAVTPVVVPPANLTSAPANLNLVVDKDGRGVTLTLAGINIHISVAA